MDERKRISELSYEARARIADNLFLQRKHAGYSQEALGERAMVSGDRISAIENGKVLAMLDAYVRLAGSLSVTVDDLLAAGYKVDFDLEALSIRELHRTYR
jgi:transcriptional regulator with XRE-family HTH domain